MSKRKAKKPAKPATPKERWTHITDADEAAAIQAAGKYRKITWLLKNGQLSVLIDEAFKAWRASREQ